MAQSKFNLSDHVGDIMKIAALDPEISVETAMNRFITNLTTMKEHHKGCPHINFHELGQHWNRLLSEEKVAQKAETLNRLKTYSGSRGKK